MADSPDFVDYWRDRIKSDLTSFSDPGAPVELTAPGRRFSAAWTMRGVPRDALFSISGVHGVAVQIDRCKMPYSGFVAAAGMADLRHVAQMILKASKRRVFVETNARRSDDASSAPRAAVELLTDLVNEEDMDATRVAMITGGAGAGKTFVLQELVRRQAERYLRGETSRLLFYVNAQGRALARLNEALATELQDLRVGLTYHSVSVLTRLGILVPVIDGFDELLGVSGYDDAFSSLAGFLDQLDGEGQILASARSVYYEEEFLARAGDASTVSGRWRLVSVAVSEWSDSSRDRYLDDRAQAEGLSGRRADRLRNGVRVVLGGPNHVLGSKPLFVARTVDMLLRDPDFAGGEDLLRELVRRLLDREQREKLLDRQSRPLLTEDQLDGLLRELAEEMWNQETRELDSRSVRELAELAMIGEEVPDSTSQVVVERMPTLACLSPGANPGGVAFEHDLFFFFFLAEVIASQLLSAKDLQAVLSRSALAEEVADRVALQAQASGRLESTEQLQQLLDRLAEACALEWRRTAQVRENAGLIVMALLRSCGGKDEGREIVGCTIRSVVFPGGHLGGVTLRRCRLIDMVIRRTDLVAARFVECEARNVRLLEPLVASDSTLLNLSGLAAEQVTGLRSRAGGIVETSYAPAVVAEILRACGASIADSWEPGASEVAPDVVELMNKLMRVYARANPVCTGDETTKKVFGHPLWPDLQKLLVKHHVVKKETRQTSGTRVTFLRRQFLPEQIMAGLRQRADVDPNIRAFWREVEATTASSAMKRAG